MWYITDTKIRFFCGTIEICNVSIKMLVLKHVNLFNVLHTRLTFFFSKLIKIVYDITIYYMLVYTNIVLSKTEAIS